MDDEKTLKLKYSYCVCMALLRGMAGLLACPVPVALCYKRVNKKYMRKKKIIIMSVFPVKRVALQLHY